MKNQKLKISERTWQEQVGSMLDLFRWRWFHLEDWRDRRAGPRTTSYAAGFPDIVAVRGSEMLWIELKSSTGTLTGPQKEWLADLQGAGQEVHVLRPGDFEWLTERLR